MKIKIFSYLLIFTLLLSFFGCTKCGRNTQIEKNEAVETQKADSGAKTSAQNINETVKKSKLLQPETIKDFLPKQISGYEKLAWSGGRSYDEKQSWTTASTEYVHKSKGFISVAIFDYGFNGFIRDRQFFDKIPHDDGEKKSYPITTDEAKGYMMWNKKNRSGLLYVLIQERYTVRIEGESVPQYPNALTDVLKLVNINKLVAEGNKSENK